jgi:2-polyprenyl-6-methoxyphenol hydroxylase-like FAD-dependent oxidoreductase
MTNLQVPTTGDSSPAIVAGAGIGGLTTALSLHAVGVPTIVLERVKDLRALGLGINLLPSAVRELFELGVGDELEKLGVAVIENVYLDADGKYLWTETRGRAAGYRWPQYSIHRGALQMLLLDAVRDRLGPFSVQTGVGVVDFAQDPTALEVQVADLANGEPATLNAALLVGADGAQSTVLACLHRGSAALRWSGVRLWRGLSFAPTLLTGRSMVIANGSEARLIAYPVSAPDGSSGYAWINWVCMARVAEPDPLTAFPGWHQRAEVDEVLSHYQGWNLGCLDVQELVEQSAQIFEHPMVDRDPLPLWSRGRVALLGDAAHLMYPVGANGASQAILDARTLAYHVATSSDPIAALSKYEAARRPVTSAILEANRAMDRSEREAAGHGTAKKAERFRAIAQSYRHTTSADVRVVNSRDSLTPSRPRSNDGLG